MSRNAIWRSPVPTVPRKPVKSPLSRASDACRDSLGKSTVAIATENIPCGSM